MLVARGRCYVASARSSLAKSAAPASRTKFPQPAANAVDPTADAADAAAEPTSDDADLTNDADDADRIAYRDSKLEQLVRKTKPVRKLCPKRPMPWHVIFIMRFRSNPALQR